MDTQNETTTTVGSAQASGSTDDRHVPSQAQVDAQQAEEQAGINAVAAFAGDHENLGQTEEVDALDWLLAPKPPLMFEIPVSVHTDRGPQELKFRVVGLNTDEIDEMEQRHRKADGSIHQLPYDCELIATACTHLVTRKRKVALNSDEFLTVVLADKDGKPKETRVRSKDAALELRFARQQGLLFGVANQIRMISGFDASRVGSAGRIDPVVAAAGNS